MLESNQLLPAPQRVELQNAWRHFAERVLHLAGTEREPLVELTYEELDELEQAAALRVPHAKLGEMLHRLRFERGSVRLLRVAEEAKEAGRTPRQGRARGAGERGKDVRFQAERWAPFWSAFIHVARNALDHGIEWPEQRAAAAKAPQGRLRIAALVEGEHLTIELCDDGRGVDGAACARKQRSVRYLTRPIRTWSTRCSATG